jgi:hypothetical protein
VSLLEDHNHSPKIQKKTNKDENGSEHLCYCISHTSTIASEIRYTKERESLTNFGSDSNKCKKITLVHWKFC